MIQRRIEDALRNWLLNCNEPAAGGLYLFRTAEGSGGLLAIRTGHSEEGEMPQDGVVICRCLDDAVQQFNQSANLWRVSATVELIYPSGRNSQDPRNVPSFDWVCDEISKALFRTDLQARLNDMADGVVIRRGFWSEPGMQTSIEGQRRAEWVLPLFISKTERKPELALA